MTAHTAGLGSRSSFSHRRFHILETRNLVSRIVFFPLSTAWRGAGVRAIPNITFSRPKTALLQTVTNSFQLIFNCFRSTGSIAGVVGGGVFGGKTGFLYFFHQNEEFLAFYFHCYIVTKVVRHSVSKGFGCNTPSKLLQNVTGCYKIFL